MSRSCGSCFPLDTPSGPPPRWLYGHFARRTGSLSFIYLRGSRAGERFFRFRRRQKHKRLFTSEAFSPLPTHRMAQHNAFAFGGATAGSQGSNAFASGSSQNTGNVLTDRPTTRLHAPPGGQTSISIFGNNEYGDAGNDNARGHYADGSNSSGQNTGNSILRGPSTRVLAPGGTGEPCCLFPAAIRI